MLAPILFALINVQWEREGRPPLEAIRFSDYPTRFRFPCYQVATNRVPSLRAWLLKDCAKTKGLPLLP